MAPVIFGDPKNDFVFYRVFGTEDHKSALIAFLNDVLELDEAHRIHSVTFLSPAQRPKVDELKNSIVDVKCIDARGITYVVEMQVLHVEAFEKRVVYNVAKGYTNQLNVGEVYPKLNDVIGISICDFELWPRKDGFRVPMLSRWRMQEQNSGTLGLPQLQFVFLELPKYDALKPPETVVEKWAYFFREAENFETIPPELRDPPFLEAMEAARTAKFTKEEWDSYINAGIAIQNERGALSQATKEGLEAGRKEGLDAGRKEGLDAGRKEGLDAGRKEGLRQGIVTTCGVLGISLDAERHAHLEALDVAGLEALLERVLRERRWL